MAVCVVAGVLIGTFYSNHFSGTRLNVVNLGSNRLNNLLHIIDDQYVDAVDLDSLTEQALPLILSNLDPHSIYVSAKDAKVVEDDLKASFSGIGVEFVIRDDTVNIMNVVKNGPADRVGVLAGDKIVTVDGKKFTGKKVTNEEAMKNLKGPSGTKVVIGVKRYGGGGIRTFTITRAEVPRKSIGAAYMIDEATGYIRIKSFAENTYPELLIALAKLSGEGAENLVIDLRDNTGGYLASAVQICNEFLPKGRVITYTEGRKSPREEYRSDGRGAYQDIPMVVLINEGSASSSEIFAGAMQDNDRATIIGRRSFGKGLVQQQIDFSDGSFIRLTVARYHTPSGRYIQKPYGEYGDDLANRYEHGEFFSKDSIKHSGPEYHTVGGRTVYGGGGITPDIFVAEDTIGMTSYYKQAVISGLVLQYAYGYADANRAKLSSFGSAGEMAAYMGRQGIVEKFADYAEKNGLKRRNILIRQSHSMLEFVITSRVVYNILDEEQWNEFINTKDNTIEEALAVFQRGDAFPKLPQKGKVRNAKK